MPPTVQPTTPTGSRCSVCGAEGPTWSLTYCRNIGVVVMHKRSITPMQVCRACVHREYWKRFAVLATVGWTSYLSVVIGPYFLLRNTFFYVRALATRPTTGALPQVKPPVAALPAVVARPATPFVAAKSPERPQPAAAPATPRPLIVAAGQAPPHPVATPVAIAPPAEAEPLFVVEPRPTDR